MKNKNIIFNDVKESIYNKDLSYKDYYNDIIINSLSIFRYEKLPESINPLLFENILLQNGHVIFTKHEDNYFIFDGSFSGVMNEYYQYPNYIVNKPTLNISKEYVIDKDCILIKNDTMARPIIKRIEKSIVQNVELDLTITNIIKSIKMLYVISASDSATKTSADLFLQKLERGDNSIVENNPFFDSVKIQTIQTHSDLLTQLMELKQYFKSEYYGKIGLETNFNMKREKLSENEVSANEDILTPYINNMLYERESAIDKINKMYGLDISVNLANNWKSHKESIDNLNEKIDTETKDDTIKENEKIDNETKDDTIKENEDEKIEDTQNKGV